MERPALSVLIPTFNNAKTIRDTLESVKWADEIFVVDSYSTDETLDVCHEYGARIVQHEYRNSATQKNWAVIQCAHEWILQIDTDEVLEPGARKEIAEVISEAATDVQAFRFPRRNHVLGRWMRYGGVYPDYQIRLLRRQVAHWRDREVHAHVEVEGQVETLEHAILHDGMPNLSKQLKNLDRYTRYEADELHKRGVRFRVHQLLLRPWLVFLHRYMWLQGFRDGWRGFHVCAYMGIYVFVTWAKLWEMEHLNLDRSPR